MDTCIFCNIIAGTIPAHRVYEDEHAIGFLDIFPVSKGHTLLVPKEHHTWFYETPDQVTDPLFRAAKKVASAVKAGVGSDYVQLSIVGKDVPHVHLHLIPRYMPDALKGWETKKYENGEAETVAEKIRLAF